MKVGSRRSLWQWCGPGSGTGVLLFAAIAANFLSSPLAAAAAPAKKLVLIAGKKSHGPEGNGIHDYPWSVKLIKLMLDNSNVADKVRVEYHLDGWPANERTLDDADAILIISDGRDGELFEEAPHFASDQRRKLIAKQIARGCGFLTFHFSTFAPDKFADDILNWSGGYFDWETDGKRQWYSAIKTLDADVQFGKADHPVLRGIAPFKLRDEFYYNIRFAADDKSLTPLWIVPAVEGRADNGNVVAWAKQRPDGGRGFGTTCGHFYDNWERAEFRKLVLNALLWSARAEVPERGVEAKYYTHAEITAALAGKEGTERAVVAAEKPIKALILTGHQYPGHLWKDTTPALKDALSKDPRVEVDVSENIEDLATDKPAAYDLLVLNYCNWEKPGLSDAAKAGFVKYLNDGGGLIIIHFSNGAFHFSLPKAGESDWPEFRKICRRVWDHTPNKSGHDAYGKFVVDIAQADHPITKGMEPFETIDELYFRQQGDEPIEVLLTARSNVTGRDEPMAFVYEYGKGRVMQTVLGHAAESLRKPGAVELIRRSAAWVAQRPQTLAVSQPAQKPANPPAIVLVEGKFGKALDARTGGLSVAGHESFQNPPLTVECRAKLANKTNYNILVAQQLKSSARHWELFSMVGSGKLTAYLPGMKPDHVSSDADVADDQWHDLAMIYEPARVRLYVDAKLVADQAVEFQQGKVVPGNLALGQLVDKVIGCTGLIDEVRISRGVREINSIPAGPLPVDDATLGLWRFDELDDQGRTPDASAHKRPAAVSEVRKKKPSDNAFYHWSKDVVGFDWTEQDSVDNRWNQTEVGPFLASIVPMPGQPPVAKGLSIKVGDKASVCYDTQTMALRSIWTGGFLKFDPARYGIIAAPQMDGELQFLSSPDAGWVAKNVKYRSLDCIDMPFTESEVDGVPVRENSLYFRKDDQRGFLCRRIFLEAAHPEMRLRIGRFAKVSPPRMIGDWQAVKLEINNQQVLCVVPREFGAELKDADNDLQLVIPPADEKRLAWILFAFGDWTDDLLKTWTTNDAISEMKHQQRTGGFCGKYPLKVRTTTRGVLGQEPGPYQVDTLTIPFDNQAKALMFITGHDFFSSGDLAVCTMHGDVWHVSGIDGKLEELRWQQIATGLFQPLGLRIVNDEVYVLGRDRITRLAVHISKSKTDSAGFKVVSVDMHENFCDLYETSPGGHDYVTCLETDPDGNFYFTHAKHGVQKVSKDGKTLETVATGLRNPNGLSVSPTGEITATPQEGEWTPASAIFMVRPGDHFGYGGPKITRERPLGYDPPLCWIPRLVDNSSAGQCWVPDDNWGLPAGSLLHFSFGQCTTSLALRESIDNTWQGGVIPLPWKFQSGVSRGRFSPHDGQLYVSGLKGWVTSAVQDGCLQRVRYVGGEVDWPVKIESYRNGISLAFRRPLDRQSSQNPENYRLEACNYRYSQGYGSPDLRPSHPSVEGRDEWDIASATLLEDERTVFLEVPDLAPVMQTVLTWSIRAADKTPLTNTYSGTLHRLPAREFPVPESSRQPRPGRLTRAEEAALVPGVLLEFRHKDHPQFHIARHLAGEFATPALRAEGFLKAPLSGDYRFRLESTVPANLRINDADIDDPSAPIRLHKGYNRVVIATHGAADGPASLRLLWQSDTFAEEPVPPTVWFHDGNRPEVKQQQRLHHGRELFERFQCGQCHAPSNAERPAEFHAPVLKTLRGRLTDRWLAAWLLNPRQIRHDAEMPGLFEETKPAERQAAADVAAYLLKAGEPAGERGGPTDMAESGEVLYEELGCIACHRFTPPEEKDAWNRSSLHFTAEKFPGAALLDYLREPQRHHRFTRMPDFKLNETEAAALADYIAQHSTGRSAAPDELTKADPDRGRKIFAERRCGNCHGPLEAADRPAKPIDLTSDAVERRRGCLADSPGASPQFPLTDADRAALREFLAATEAAISPLTAREQSDSLMRRLNCAACHHRDHVVSPRGEIIAEESERGVPPAALPNLTWAGDKLHADWMRRLFQGAQPRKIRPWISARMPAFPAYADALAAGLAAEHGVSVGREGSFAVEPDLAEIGRRLALKDNGLDCRQCHAVAGQKPTGDDQTKIAPGIDFAETKARMRSEFYRRFVLDPPRHDVTIRMPKFALDGKTTQAAQVFDGDAVRQFDALWHYIQSLPTD